MKKKNKLILPHFKNEDEEIEFWDKFDLSDYATKEDMVPVYFPNLKPTSSTISLRMPQFMLGSLKERANFMDMPYQSLIKKYVADGLARDRALREMGRKK